ncbi:hypothetical protein DFR55_101204 [Herbinix hemicellulosilytica]|uniref:Membrane protein YczE n=1 Tax=Herbinix hemicellulosilytica TaxID=1564487 RepID=A0A0H5SHZ4_HERHM|nr:hypothetical protein [Herbinix hemicellulosilytica]RBP60744.1 hypothetical protein DFR55_101204 [Herbinix hemicellulosilytica]CRZ34431.1 hypothetical protein HHT355_1229 [Herbinix hemicellulosilytica]
MIKKLMGVFIAINGVGCGISLFLQSGLGSDPIGVLCDGISRSLNISIGQASLIYNLIVILIAAIVAKGNLGLGTVIYALLSGYFIDFYNWIFAPLKIGELNFLGRLAVYVIGEILLAAALAMLIYFKLGMNALDAVLYKVNSLTGISYAVLRTGCDILYSILGVILGGVFGIGTLISFLTTGYLVGKFTRIMDAMNRLNKDNKSYS